MNSQKGGICQRYLVGRIGVEVPGLGILAGCCRGTEGRAAFLGILSTLTSPRMLDREFRRSRALLEIEIKDNKSI